MTAGAAFVDTFRRIAASRDIVLMLVFAALFYGVYYPAPYRQGEARDVRVALVDEAASPLSRSIATRLDASRAVRIAARPASMEEARSLLLGRQVDGVLLIPANTAAGALRGEDSGIAIWVNGTYLVRAKAVGGALQQALGDALRDAVPGDTRVEALTGSVTIVSQPLFNPELAYAAYIFPAVTPVILQQTLLFGAALMFAGRRFGGFQEVTGRWLALTAVSTVLTLLYVTWFFALQQVPRQASAPALILTAAVGGASFAAFALFGASLFRTPRAALVMLIPTSLPIFFLSGATWPRQAMPVWVNAVGSVFPSTHISRALLLVDQMGAPLSAAMPSLLIALGIGAVCLTGVLARSRR